MSAARAALAGEEPVVVDAGGLDLLDASVLESRRGRPTLLTPHAGECARLLGRLEGEQVARDAVEGAPLEHARRLARATGASVLLKGSTTLVVPPGEGAAVWSQSDAPSWLATAGAGDVLAGLLGTLLAAGLAPHEAGALGALVHGVAAEHANPGGPVRALAVARALPGTVATLLRRS
ncbi:ADP-dependent NAD(P)H-hydrate dehydratase [Phycicoccus endophyticus]